MSTLFACHDGADPSPIENVYFDSGSGEIFVFNQGQKVVVGSLPTGTNSMGQETTLVVGPLSAGNATAATVPDFHFFYGATVVANTPGNEVEGDNTMQIVQSTPLAADSDAVALSISRGGVTVNGKYLYGMLSLFDSSGQTDGMLLQAESTVVPGAFPGNTAMAFQLNAQGGIALFGKTTVPTAPRTLAQSVINAITDANAKTAVQALANALADMGALTLT